MSSARTSAFAAFLLLLFCGTLCASMIIPFMGFFIVEGLGYDPWVLSVYSVLAVGLTLLANRHFAGKIDDGARVFPLIGAAALGYVAAASALSLAPTLAAAMSFGVVGFGIASSATSSMFSIGGNLAEHHQIERPRFNAYMRATTSTAWMIGPAITFLIADRFGAPAVFPVALSIALVWIALWWRTLPRDMVATAKPPEKGTADLASAPRDLWLAAGFIFGLSMAHSLTFTALPIFYVAEVGLPAYAPGLAFSVKTFIEVIAIFSTPMVIARFGMRPALLATSLLAVVSILILASVETLPQMIAGAALEGLYYGFYASLGISYVQSFATDRPARATAIYWNTLILSGLLAGPLVGAIAQAYDFQSVLHLASGVALLAAVTLFLSRSKTAT